jgi:hypothetical protein
MPYFDLFTAGVGHKLVDSIKPTLDSGKELYVFTELFELISPNMNLFLFGFFVQKTPIGEHRLFAELLTLLVYLCPEFSRIDANFRKHRILLHWLRR